MASLSIENLYKQYRNADSYAVDNLSFTCAEGEFVAILGPSGCGKTTTLRMIAGLEQITAGKISIAGRAINDMPPRDRGIGLAFEDYALYPPLNVFDNIAFNLRANKVPERTVEQKVRQIADLLHVQEILHKKPKQLSGGQKQRVNIARAIVREPKVLLLDEPMSHLDGKLRQVLRYEIRRLHQKIGCTTILVTHDQLEAMSLADRMAIMDNGLLQQFATPAEVFNAPHNEFVAGFIGDPPMNIIDAEIQSIEGQKHFSFYGHSVPVPPGLDARAKLRNGQALRFGIRPDDILLAEDGTPVEIAVFENLGEEKRLSIYLQENLYLMISSAENRRYSVGDSVNIRFREDKVHIFVRD